MKKTLIALCSLVIAIGTGVALADLNYTQGSGTVIFDFICFTTKHCSAHVNIDSTGTEKFTSANPGTVILTPTSSSNSFATGSVAAGAFATGSLSFGAGVDGWNQTEGAKSDAAWSTGSGSIVAIDKAIAINTAALVSDPCASAAKTNFALASSTGTIQVVGGSTSKKVYVCSISIIAATGAVVSMIEGTGATCATANEGPVIGSTTASTGMSLAINGGFTLGNGGGTVAVTTTATNGICILQSGTAALAGNVTYVQQ